MTSRINSLRTALAIAIAVTAIAVPTATARPIDDVGPLDEYRVPTTTSLDVAASPVASPTSDGFDWGDAGIGAGAMLALGSIAAGALVATGHGTRPRQSVA